MRVRVCECMRSSSRCLDELDDFHRDVQTDRDEPVHVDQVREEAAHPYERLSYRLRIYSIASSIGSHHCFTRLSKILTLSTRSVNARYQSSGCDSPQIALPVVMVAQQMSVMKKALRRPLLRRRSMFDLHASTCAPESSMRESCSQA